MEQPRPPAGVDQVATPPKTLNEFAQFMHPDRWGAGWTLVEGTTSTLRYEKALPAQQGSCVIAAILLLLGLIPGVVYMVYARKPARTLRLVVSRSPSGTLVPSGDHEAVAVFNGIIGRRTPFPVKPLVLVIGVILLVVLLSSCSRS